MTKQSEIKARSQIKKIRPIVSDCIAAAKDDTTPDDTIVALLEAMQTDLTLLKLNMRGIDQPDFTRNHASALREHAHQLAGKALMLAAASLTIKGHTSQVGEMLGALWSEGDRLYLCHFGGFICHGDTPEAAVKAMEDLLNFAEDDDEHG
jgi:hypothetical protein